VEKTKEGVAMTKTVLLFLAFLLPCSVALAQQTQVIQIGPFGKPLMVEDIGGQSTIPIQIYSSSDMDVYVPDVTRPGWIEWNTDAFKTKSVYSTYLYLHFKTNAACEKNERNKGRSDVIPNCSILRYQRNLIKVDVRQNAVTILDELLMDDPENGSVNYRRPNETLSLADKKNKELATLVNDITAIIEKEVNRSGNVLSAQEAMKYNRIMTAHSDPKAQRDLSSTAQWQCEESCLRIGPGQAFDLCMEKCR
jgi:hypothetical protein